MSAITILIVVCLVLGAVWLIGVEGSTLAWITETFAVAP